MNERDLTPQSKQKNDFWFLRVAMQASIFGAAFLAYSKIKGPASQILSSYTENQLKLKQKREEFKSFWDDSIIENRKSRFYTYSMESPRKYDSTLGRNLYGRGEINREVELRNASMAESYNLEKSIFGEIRSDLVRSGIRIKRLKGEAFTESDFSEARLKKLNIDELFFEVRRKTLLIYLAKNPELSGGDLSRIKALNDPIKDQAKIHTLHLAYLREDPTYAKEYNSEVYRFKTNYRNQKFTQLHPGRPNPPFRGRIARAESIEEVKEWGLGNRLSAHDKFMSAFSPAARMATDRIISRHKITVFKQDQIWKELNSGKKYTSSSFAGAMDYLRGDIFKVAGQFDYTNDIKELIQTVMDLNSNPDKTGFSNLFVEIVKEGSLGGPQHYLKITGSHNGTSRDYDIKVPLAQNGFLPASNPAGRERHDFAVPKSYGKVGKNVDDFLNSTQLLLRSVTKALKGSLINSTKTNPYEAFRRIKNTMANILEPAARLEGTPRDAITGLIIIPLDKRISNKLTLGRNFKSLDVFRQMSHFKNSGAINITIDLETISPGQKRYGPDISAVDAHTQITQAAFSVGEMDYRGRYNILDMKNNISAHGVKVIEALGGVSAETADFLKKYLKDEGKSLGPNAKPDDVFRAWANEQTKNKTGNFQNNHDIARTTIKQILEVVENNKGKPIYITTKFGTTFDLKLLEIWAPHEYAELRDKAPHLDLHGVAQLKQITSGSLESISQTDLLKSMMKSYSPSSNYDFNKREDLHRAIDDLVKGKHIVLSNQMAAQIQKMKNLGAHDAGIDTILLHSLVGFNLNDYIGNKETLDTEFDFLRSQFNRFHKFKTIEEQYNETIGLERTEAFGFLTSSTGLSQGLVAKQYLSLMATRHFLLNPDVPVTKQWNQMLGGLTTMLSRSVKDKLTHNGVLNRKAFRKILYPSIITSGELDATSYFRKEDAMRNLFGHTINVKYFGVIGGFGMQEGVHRLSAKVLTKANLHYTEQINLSEVAGLGSDANLSNKVREMHQSIYREAKILASKRAGTPVEPLEIDYIAAADKLNSENRWLFKIPKGTQLLASTGSKGSATIKAPVDGVIKNIRIDFNDGELKTYADVEYYLNAESGQPHVVRGMFGKAVGVFDKLVTEGKMYGGVEGYGPAQFLEKEYWGSMKTIVLRNGMENLFDDYEKATGTEKVVLGKKIKYWASQLNSQWNEEHNMLISDSYKDVNFKKIKDNWTDAQKVIGPIELNMAKLRSFMHDTKHTWTIEQANMWYKAWDAKGGEAALQKFYENELKKVEDFYNKPNGDLGKIILDMDHSTKEYYKEQHIKLLKEFILPDRKIIGKGGPVARFFEAREKIKGTSIFDIGVMGTDAMVFYGMMTGTHGRKTNIKLRRSILGQVANFDFVMPKTKELLENARLSNVSGKAEAVAATRRSFIDTIFGEMAIKKKLNITNIKEILDIRKGLNVEKLKRLNLDKEQINEVVKELESIIEGFGSSQAQKDEAIKIIDELNRNDFYQKLTSTENKTWASLDYAHRVAQLGLEHEGVWAINFDENKSISNAVQKYGLLDFDIDHLFNMFPDITKLHQNIPSKDVVHNMFSKLFESKNQTLIDNISIDKNKIKLKNVIMRAQVNPLSAINLLTKPGAEEGLGMVTEEMRSVNEVLKAYEEFVKLSSTDNKEVIQQSVSLFQKQYLTHMLRGFMDVKEDQIELKGFTGRSMDSNQIFQRMHEIKRMGGFGKIDSFKATKEFSADMATQWLDRMLEDFHMSDVFVHEDFYKNNMDFNYQENKLIQSESHYNLLKSKYGDQAARKMMIGQKFYGELVRYPISPAGHLPMLASRFNVIPKEVAEYFGMDVNMMAVSAEYWKLVRGDNDGDLIYGIIHAHETEKALRAYGANHQQNFNNILNTIIDGGNKDLVKLKDYLKGRKLVGGIDTLKNEVILDQYDEAGYAKRTVAELGSEEARIAMENNFKTITSLFGGVNLHDPAIITDSYVKARVDNVGLISVSKNSIGIFENLVTTRREQILAMDKYKKFNVEALHQIFGNVFSGFGGMAQGSITLGKHGTADMMKQLSLVVQALNIGSKKNDEASKALLNWMKGFPDPTTGARKTTPLYSDELAEMVHRDLTEGMAEYQSTLNAKDKMAYYQDQIKTTMELGKEFSPFMEIIANAPQNLDYQAVKKATLLPRPQFTGLKAAGKFGAIGAAIFLAGNFFSPNRLSNSINPFHAFTDLGVDLDGNNNSIFADLELDRDVPIDSVQPSFSKKAFIRVNELTNSRVNKEKSDIITQALKTSFDDTNPFIHEWRTPPNLTYTNYTSNINYLGSSQLERRYSY